MTPMAPPRKTIDQLPEQSTYEGTNYLVVQDEGVTKKMAASLIVNQTSSSLQAHLDDTTDAHDASAISATASGTGVDGANVQAQLGQLLTALDSGDATTNAALQAHLADASDAHDASAISATSSGTGVDAADVQAQLVQLAALVESINANLATLAATYVDVAGDTMIGNLTLSGAARLIVGSGGIDVNGDFTQVPGNTASLGNTTAYGPVTLPADPTDSMQAATKQYVDTHLTQAEADPLYVNTAGDTMTGPLTLNADPAAALQAATKQYVDASGSGALDRALISANFFPPADRESNCNRLWIVNTADVFVSGNIYFGFFYANQDRSVTKCRTATSATAAAATPTLCKVGLYSVDPVTYNGTLIGQTANDTTLWSAVHTWYERALDGTLPQTFNKDGFYASAILIVSALTRPTFVCMEHGSAGTIDVALGTAPRPIGVLQAQADLPSSFLGTQVVNTRAHPYVEFV